MQRTNATRAVDAYATADTVRVFYDVGVVVVGAAAAFRRCE